MSPALEPPGRLPRRLLGYDRKAVDAALSVAADRLHRAEARRDELLETTANVERIGAQVAEMLRSLADRARELEDQAAAQGRAIVHAAEVEAERIRAQAAAVLADAQETARDIGERRETALISLRIAIDQMGRLATLVDQIDLTAAEAAPAAAEEPPAEEEETVVLLPWYGSKPVPPTPSASAEDPIAPILARLDGRATS